MIYPHILEWDNFLTDVELDQVLNDAYDRDYTVKGVYQGRSSSVPASQDVVKLIVDKLSERLGVYTHWKRHFTYRLSFQGQEPGVYNGIHNDVNESATDRNMMSVILYLQGFKEDEAMNFYTSEAFSTYSFQPTLTSSIASVKEQWKIYRSVSIKKNKLIAFSSALFHGINTNDGMGSTMEDGRLILPLFIYIGFNEVCHPDPEPDVVGL